MPITTKVDNDNLLTTHTVIGEISFEEAMTTLKQFWKDRQTMNILWDLRIGGLAHLSAEEVEAISYHIKQYSEKRPEGKTAIIVSSDLEYGISRMIKTLGVIKRFSFQMEISKSYEDAIRWLDEE